MYTIKREISAGERYAILKGDKRMTSFSNYASAINYVNARNKGTK